MKIKKYLKNYTKNSILIVFTDFFNKAIPFILVPILTKYLSPEDFGRIATFNSVSAIGIIFIGLNLNNAILVNYYKFRNNDFVLFLSNSLMLSLLAFLLICTAAFLINIVFNKAFGIPIFWLIMALLNAFSLNISNINVSFWLAKKNIKVYSVYQIFHTIFKLGLSLYFIISLSMDWKGRVLAITIGSIFFSLISMLLLYRNKAFEIRWSRKKIKESISFGVPLIPHGLGSWFRNGAVIIILMKMLGSEATGLFEVANKLALSISIFAMAINKAYIPFLYSELSKEDSLINKRRIVKITYFVFFILLSISLIFLFLSKEIITIILDENFHEVLNFLPWLIFGSMFYGMYLFFVDFLFYAKKSALLSKITIGTSLLNVFLTITLVETFQVNGAAIAIAVSFLVSLLLVFYFSNRVIPMPWIKSIKFSSNLEK